MDLPAGTRVQAHGLTGWLAGCNGKQGTVLAERAAGGRLRVQFDDHALGVKAVDPRQNLQRLDGGPPGSGPSPPVALPVGQPAQGPPHAAPAASPASWSPSPTTGSPSAWPPAQPVDQLRQLPVASPPPPQGPGLRAAPPAQPVGAQPSSMPVASSVQSWGPVASKVQQPAPAAPQWAQQTRPAPAPQAPQPAAPAPRPSQQQGGYTAQYPPAAAPYNPPDQQELRIDRTDGRAYTKHDFYVCYGGYSEWENAPRVPPEVAVLAAAAARQPEQPPVAAPIPFPANPNAAPFRPSGGSAAQPPSAAGSGHSQMPRQVQSWPQPQQPQAPQQRQAAPLSPPQPAVQRPSSPRHQPQPPSQPGGDRWDSLPHAPPVPVQPNRPPPNRDHWGTWQQQQPQGDTGTWPCQVCTFVNPSAESRCSMCDTPRGMSQRPQHAPGSPATPARPCGSGWRSEPTPRQPPQQPQQLRGPPHAPAHPQQRPQMRPQLRDGEKERREDPSQPPGSDRYCFEQFVEFYGEEKGLRYWERAANDGKYPPRPTPAVFNILSQNPQGNRVGDYELGKELGQGTFSTVRAATNVRTRQEFAVKVIRKGASPEGKSREQVEDEVRWEVSLMRLLQHRNIVRLIEGYESPSSFYIVLESVRGGDLATKLRNAKGQRLSEGAARPLWRGLCEGIAACHGKGIAHRDIRPENCLISSDNTIKVTDFGVSAWHRDLLDINRDVNVGTVHYCAPEVLDGYYNAFRADFFSAGCVLFQMLTGKYAYGKAGQSEEQVEEILRHGQFNAYPKFLSPEARDLIGRLLRMEPSTRPGWPESLRHPWSTGTGAGSASVADDATDVSSDSAAEIPRKGGPTLAGRGRGQGAARGLLIPKPNKLSGGPKQGGLKGRGGLSLPTVITGRGGGLVS
eukprot:TRINITY_DN3830_c0_g1_i1.p1 TRINITY_DN3830_c0_g1~~TRINITY_DN3830_c0_g1_i1.p1  ORF type:complete len:902 (+),score=186.19 TRINITY_DN3830_c0_g1_i1:99-2804(+)